MQSRKRASARLAVLVVTASAVLGCAADVDDSGANGSTRSTSPDPMTSVAGPTGTTNAVAAAGSSAPDVTMPGAPAAVAPSASTAGQAMPSAAGAESGSPGPISVTWSEDMGASLFVSDRGLRAHVQSNRPAPLSIELVAITQVAGTPVLRLVEHIDLAAQSGRDLVITPAMMPAQSTGAPLSMQLVGFVEEEGVVRRVPSAGMQVSVSAGGAVTYASGLHSYGPLAASSLGGKTEHPVLAHLIDPARHHLARTAGGATALPDVQSLLKTVASASPVTYAADAVFPTGKPEDARKDGVVVGQAISAPESLLPAATPASTPPIIIPFPLFTPVSVCGQLNGVFTDSHYGEDYVNEGIWVPWGKWGMLWMPLPHPARFATAWVIDASSRTAWHGQLDANGCTPTLYLPGGSYSFQMTTKLVSPQATYDVLHIYPQAIDQTCAQTTMRGTRECLANDVSVVAISVPRSLSAVTVNAPAGPETPASRVASVAGQILSMADNGLVAGQTYTVYADAGCQQFGWQEACAEGGGAYFGIGIGTGHKDTTLEKFVIAHELGHEIQGKQGLLQGGAYTADPSAPISCRCDFVAAANSLHCLQSRHGWATAEAEGWAHFISQRTFNSSDKTNATFVYYKEVRTDDGVVHTPPYAVNASQPVRWLESHCQATNDTIEWDILTFLRGLQDNGGTDALTMTDIFGAYRAAGGRYWGGMLSGAASYFGGVNSPKYQRFSRSGYASGVVH